VLIGKYSGNEIKVDNQDLLIIREDEVLGILEGQRSWRKHRKGLNTMAKTDRIQRKLAPGNSARVNQLADTVKITLGPKGAT